MKFNITYEISPSGAFGIPQAGKIVYPAEKSKGFLGDTLHMRTLTRVAHGTLSQYRQEEAAIDLPLDLGIVKGKLRDNFIYLEVEGGSIPETHKIATEALETFLQHLAASTRTVYAAKTLYVESEDGTMCLVPKSAESSEKTPIKKAKNWSALILLLSLAGVVLSVVLFRQVAHPDKSSTGTAAENTNSQQGSNGMSASRVEPSLTSPSATEPSTDTYRSNDLGSLSKATPDEAYLIRIYGGQNVQSKPIHIGEGEFQQGTLIFPKEPTRTAGILWKTPIAKSLRRVFGFPARRAFGQSGLESLWELH